MKKLKNFHMRIPFMDGLSGIGIAVFTIIAIVIFSTIALLIFRYAKSDVEEKFCGKEVRVPNLGENKFTIKSKETLNFVFPKCVIINYDDDCLSCRDFEHGEKVSDKTIVFNKKIGAIKIWFKNQTEEDLEIIFSITEDPNCGPQNYNNCTICQ